MGEKPIHERVIELLAKKYPDESLVQIEAETDPFVVEFRTSVRGMFEGLIDDLRRCVVCRDAAIMGVAKLYWNLTGNRFTPTTISATVPSISFAVVSGKKYADIGARMLEVTIPDQGKVQFVGLTMLPYDWLEIVKNDKVYAMGSIVFIASQARDYYNLKFVTEQGFSDKMRARASAYESQFLLAMQRNGYAVPSNKWQRQTLEQYPAGLASLAADLQYTASAGPPDS